LENKIVEIGTTETFWWNEDKINSRIRSIA